MKTMIPAWVNGTLKPVEKLQAHIDGLRHKAVSVFVIRGDEVLLQQRALSKYHTPGLWANTCCTHPAWMEDPRACAIRRLEEELGITGLDPVQRDHLEYWAEVGNGLIEHEVVDVFVAEAPETLRFDLNPDEVMAVRWVPLAQLREVLTQQAEQFTPWIKIYIDKHRDAIFGDQAQSLSHASA